MRTKKASSLLGHIICILFISLSSLGGCDIEFSSDNDNDGGNGDQEAILKGTITSIIPNRNLDGITVEVEDEDTGTLFPDVTDTNGFFQIEGGFSGSSVRLEFFDENQMQIALTSITVFPGAEVDLGDITINNRSVTFEDDIIVIFEGDIIENNCSQGVGTIEVTVDDTEVIVEISSSTDIVRDNDDLVCEDLLIGDQVEIRGELLINNTVGADRIELL
ncbi:MAG: hypothetical protein HYW01_14150 [Deltaproteobacteria bacterium]|nr:hypothetical protein [Deltaproteobacteria bacterium]